MRCLGLLAGSAALGVAMIGVSLSPDPAAAGYVVTLTQVGSDVVATGSGAIDLIGLTLVGSDSNTCCTNIFPSLADIVTGNGEAIIAASSYAGFSGPATFGSGGEAFPDSKSGDFVGLGTEPGGNVITVPFGYVSDSPLSDAATYGNETFASLGVTPGTYVWTWGRRGPDQKFTLVIPASVPEPSTVLLLLVGAGCASVPLAHARRRARLA
jgi:hypothetical protein